MVDGVVPHDFGLYTVISVDQLVAEVDYLAESGDLLRNFRVFLKQSVHRLANDFELSFNRDLSPAIPDIAIEIHAGSEALEFRPRLINIGQRNPRITPHRRPRVTGSRAAKQRASSDHVIRASGQYQRGMRASPQRVLRRQVPWRAKPQPPPGCPGQQSSFASLQACVVTSSSPDSDKFQSSCTDGYRPGGAHRTGHLSSQTLHTMRGFRPALPESQNAPAAVINHLVQVNQSRKSTIPPHRRRHP